MTFACTIGSYSLVNFVRVNALYLRHVFGPDTPVLISDDKSPESPQIESAAADTECGYTVSPARRSHFAGDMQSLINAVAYGRQVGADIAVKISQRFWLVSPEIRQIAETIFGSRPEISIVLPGRPDANRIIGSRGFAKYPFLTDIMFLRVSAFDPEQLKTAYESHWKNGRHWWSCFVELTINDMLMGPLKENYSVFNELTEHTPAQPYRYLRRYQNTSQDYAKAAARFNVQAHWPTSEWKNLEIGYRPQPRA